MRTLVLTCLMFAAASGAAHAQPAGQDPALVAAPAQHAPPRLDAAELEDSSGRAGVTTEALSLQQLSGATTDVSVTAGSLTSGEVRFEGGALDGFSGIGNFVVNTGANNTLQGAINISIATVPQS